jgi:hypothetical protein
VSLLQVWQTSPEQIQGKQLHQLIAFAGDGKLRDGRDTSAEFRAFLSSAPSAYLQKFVDECLGDGFTDSGLALQDIVNEVGRRLGFKVENGLYQGRQGTPGYDGLWTLPENRTLIVEVKTTDAYRIDTDRIAGYRRTLIASEKLAAEASSILIVVGRQDTGDLEAQIRGSRHAWDIRLISAEALMRLMRLKEALDDPSTIRRISEILIPREYTKVDQIVELVFSAAEEVKNEPTEPDPVEARPDGEKAPVATPGKPLAFHEACISRLSKREKAPLIRQSLSTFSSPDGELRAVCAVSKNHGDGDRSHFWFAFHPHQDSFLEQSKRAFMILGCGTADHVVAIPHTTLRGWLDDLWTTERVGGAHYWHLRLVRQDDKTWIDRRKGKGRLDITKYVL